MSQVDKRFYMNRKLLGTYLALFLFITGAVQAQKVGVIKGTITDKQSNGNIPFASVAAILTSDTKTVGTVSDVNGVFSINKLSFGTYDVVVSFMGYTADTIHNVTINSNLPVYDAGKIGLQPSKIAIKEVNVTAMQSTVVNKIDRKSYSARDFETAKGGTAVDILDKLPSVSVDGEGIVSVRGTSDFMVYINGKPAQTNASDILNQIPAGQIRDIDIVTVPGARYDAQGKGGIINITTQKGAMDGLSVLVNGMLGGSPWTNAKDVYSHQKLNNDRYSSGLSLMYNKKSLSISGSFTMQSRNNKGKGIIDPYIHQHPDNAVNGFPGMYYVLDGEGSRPKWYTNIMGSMALSFQVNKRAELTANYQYSQRTSGRTANYAYDAYFANEPGANPRGGTLQEIFNPNDIHRNGWFSNLSVDYKQKLGNQSQWGTSLIYETSDLEQTIDNKEFAYDGERYYYNDAPVFHSFQSDKTPLYAYRFVFGYQHGFDNGNTLNMGVQPQWVRLDGEFTYDTIIGNDYWGGTGIKSYNNSIDLKRDVYAAYADFNGESGKLKYIVGLRFEYTDQLMNVVSTEYFEYVYAYFVDVGNGRDFNQTDFSQQKPELFPTVHLNYGFNKLNSLSLAASRRINRPPAKDMAPFLYRRHQEIYEMGDPLLEPEYILNAELNYTRKFGKNNLILTGFYRGVDNAIYRVNRVAYDMGNPGGVLLRSYTNAGNQVALGTELGINFHILSKVKLFVGGAAYDFRVIADDELLGESRNSRSTNWNVKSNLNWSVIKPLKFTLNYSFKSGSVTPQGKSKEFQALNAALNYSPERLSGWSFSVKMQDILGTNQTGGYTAAYEGEQILLRRNYVYDYEGQILELGISYTFNNKKEMTQKKYIGDEYF